MGRDDSIGCYHVMPNAIAGHTDVVDEILVALAEFYYFVIIIIFFKGGMMINKEL